METNEWYYCNSGAQSTEDIECSEIIGYSPKSVQFFLIVFPLLGLISNCYLIFYYFSKRKEKNKQSTTNTMIFILSIIDFLTSIYWILSYMIFHSAQDIVDSKNFCLILSVIYLFIFSFTFVYLFCILLHFINLNYNSIDSILKPQKILIKYISISGGISIAEVILTGMLKQLGRGPMMTCFVKTGNPKIAGGFKLFVTLLIPLLTISLCSAFIYYQSKKDLFDKEKGLAVLYKSYTRYIIIYESLNAPLLLLIILSSMKSNISYDIGFFSGFAYITSLISSLIPFIMSIIRVLFDLVRIEWLRKFLKKDTPDIKIKGAQRTTLTLSPLIPGKLNEDTDFEQIENKIMKNTIRDILIGISYSLEMEEKPEELKNSPQMKNFEIKYSTVRHIINDYRVNEDNFQGYEFIDYLPRTFLKLRTVQKVDTKDIIQSVLPKNNQLSIDESAGKSGAFFIKTADNNFIIKSLKSEECELIRQKFLVKYLTFIEKNPKSLLCPIYGMYKMISANGDEKHIIIMRNLMGNFSNNIMCKYDLKGSNYKRSDEFKFEKVDSQVMKDLDFFSIEKVLMFPNGTITSFKDIVKKDSSFLNEQELMDYSLLVVKISIDKQTATEIFGKSYNKDREKAFKEMMSSKESSISIGIDEKTASSKYKHYRRFLYPSLTEGTAYIIGIIDYFQYYNVFKLMETKYKNILFNKSSKKEDTDNTNESGEVYISCADPKTYKSRFDLMVDKITKVKELLSKE